MAGFKALSMGAKAALLAAGAAAAALAGYGGWALRHAPTTVAVVPPEKTVSGAIAPADVAVETASSPAKPATETDAATPAATPAAAPAEMPLATPEQDPDAAGLVENAPSFDVVRVEPNGTTVVAGKAEPGSQIVLRVDGAEISATTADANGNFAAFFVLDSSEAPRMLTMTSILADQSEVAATAEVALAPTKAPVVIAAVEPLTVAPDTKVATPEALAAAAPDTPAALLITKDGAKVLQSGEQPAATGSVTDLTIDTISYTPAGDVQLSGRAAAGAFLRIYLDNAPLIDLKAGADGHWASTMPPIAPGIYTLRADQLAADGTVTARFETPFKRETQDALAAATQTPDVAVDVAVAEPAIEPAPATEPLSAEPTAAEPTAAEPVATAEAGPVPEPTANAATIAPAAPATPQSTVEPVAVAVATTDPKPTAPVSITVQPGFTLWGIASQQFGDGVMYVQVFEANKDKIRDPDLIYPGQVFVIPKALE